MGTLILLLQFAVVLVFIFMGARIGGIGIGAAGGFGVMVLALVFGMAPGAIPVDVILIIMSVITAVAAMQVAGGMDYLVAMAEKILRKNPKRITLLAPIVTYVMTLMAGTGHTAFSTLPVIAEVAKENNIRPSRPLSIAVVASQIAITASPISAATVALAGFLEPKGVDYLSILAICIPTTFLACVITGFVCNFLGSELKDDPVYQAREQQGLVSHRKATEKTLKPGAKLSVVIFLIAIFLVMFYATAISSTVGLIKNPILLRDHAIMVFMLAASAFIILFCKLNSGDIASASTFRSGMVACVCVLGVAWLGNTFVEAHAEGIKMAAGNLLTQYPWMLAIVLFFASTLLYSQAATTKTLVPLAIALGAAPVTIIASFAAVSALFVLPTYPTLLAAVEMDDTGSTRIGKYIFDHPFIIPGTCAISLSVMFGFILGNIIL